MADAADIDSIAALEAAIGKTPPAVNLKVIDHADAGACRWLAAAPLLFAGVGGADALTVTLAGGAPGFARADPATLSIPCAAFDDPELLVPGRPFASLFLIPGIGETLRINGHIEAVTGGEAHIAIADCYAHCAKALIRSTFWQAEPIAAPAGDAAAFAAATRFMALATVDPHGAADISPKGDPAGAMVRFDEAGDLWFAERPGNRRADGLRNIVAQPRIAAALLVPGADEIMLIRGRARATTDAAACAAFTVQDKTPLLATRVADLTVERRASPALARARLWPAAPAPADIRPAKIFADHVRLNKNKGLAARVAGALVSVPGLMQKGLDKDYKDNLY